MTAQVPTEAKVTATMNQAIQWMNQGNYQNALDGFLTVGESLEKQETEVERQVYVISQTMAVKCYGHLQQYEEAFLLSGKLLHGNLNSQETLNLQKLHVKNGYRHALSLSHDKQYAEARAVLNEILAVANADMRKQIFDLIPITWYFEGLHLNTEQKYQQALDCFEQALNGFKEIGVDKYEGETWGHIGDLRSNLLDGTSALEAYRQAGIIASDNKDSATLMSILIKQFQIYKSLDNDQLASTVMFSMDSLADNVDNDEMKFLYFNMKGDEAAKQKNYDLAELWYHKNDQYVQLLDKENKFEKPHQHYLNFSNLYKKSGNLDEALKYALLKKDVLQREYDESDWLHYSGFLDIAYIYSQMGDSTNCFQTFDTLFASKDKCELLLIDREELHVKRAWCYSSFMKYEETLADYKMADELLATQFDEHDAFRVKLVPLIGGMEHKLGHYEESERMYRKYVDAIRHLYGENHIEYIEALGYLANAEAFAGHIDAACRDYVDATNNLKRQIRQRLPFLTTAEREGYWKNVSELFMNMTPFALKAEEYQTEFTRSCYDCLVLSKAFLLASERSALDLINDSGPNKENNLKDFATISFMQSKITEWGKDEKNHVDSILYLTSRINQMESSLAQNCRGFGDMASFMDIDYQTVKKNLKDGEVLIDFTDFTPKSGGRIYAAYLLNNKQDYPLLKKLFAESEIDSLKVTYPDMYYDNDTVFAEELLRRLWKPFEEDLEEGTTVYYVPSQMLFRFAIESLPVEDGTLLGDHYRFIRLSSAREIASTDSKTSLNFAPDGIDATLYGGLWYNIEENTMVEEAEKHVVSQPLAYQDEAVRSNDSFFRYLPWSGNEVDSIKSIFESHGKKVKVYKEGKGTEESFLNMSGMAPRFLHISTHGFCYTPDEALEVDYLQGYQNAMSLTGLVMSGGNAAWTGQKLPQGAHDGILTAINIAQMDLSGVDLVVLSSCRSGCGRTTSEGLYGLQRAFKKAGAQTMIMSLWNVSDKVSAEFMTCFYRSLFDKGNAFDKRNAFDKAKQQIREKYPEPYYWAGFIILD